MSTVKIQAGTYSAVLVVGELWRLPIVQVRKLFKLMRSYGWENAMSIEELRDYLASAISEAAADCHTASYKSAQEEAERKLKGFKRLLTLYKEVYGTEVADGRL